MKLIAFGILSWFLSSLFSSCAYADSIQKATTMWRRLLGSSPQPEDAQKLAVMVGYLTQGKPVQAANVLTGDIRFINNPVFDLGRRWSEHEGKAELPLNDMSALIMGIVKDELDFRFVLTGNMLYIAGADFKLNNQRPPGVSLSNNNHFEFLFNGSAGAEALVRRDPQWPGTTIAKDVPSGVLTTRGFASTYLNMGTNRAAIAYGVYEKFLCKKFSEISDASLSDAWVGRDVERDPGGNPQEYLTKCAGCHTQIDAQRGAFAYLDFTGGSLQFLNNVAPKMYRDDNVNYASGFRPRNSSWSNTTAQSKSSDLGWTGNLSGAGVNAFGAMVSNSQGFVDCMVETVFKQICGRHSNDDERATTLKRIANKFVFESYNMKRVYEEIAALDQCTGT